MKTYSSKDLKIPYSDITFLRKNKQLALGIDNNNAQRAILNKTFRPSNKSIFFVYRFWDLLSTILLIFTIYLSFSSNWWWFIVGIIAMSIIHKSNVKGNANNLAEEAFVDQDFYTKLLDLGAWIYKIDEEIAKKYLNKNDQ